MSAPDYLKINRDAWNKRVDGHIASDFYNNDAFLKGKSSLNEIELNLLGDINSESVLHLQCHFGQDSISLARLGASTLGIDLSEEAISKAKEMAESLKAEATFVCCDVYSTPEVLKNQTFDIVFTSYGTIGWLPDIDQWADVVHKMLKPGGRLVFVEFHPVIWMYDDKFEKVSYRYFNDEPIVESIEGSYAAEDSKQVFESVSWNHGLAEVMGSLLKKGFVINRFEEHDYSPYNCFSGTIESSPGKFQIEKFGNKIPMVYAIEAIKPGTA